MVISELGDNVSDIALFPSPQGFEKILNHSAKRVFHIDQIKKEYISLYNFR